MDRANQVKSFRDLIAWQKAMNLVCLTYRQTATIHSDERFGIISQMRRCAVSIPSNIAEGWGRDTRQDYLRFLQIARGSALELSTQSEICDRLSYEGAWDEVCLASEEVARILNGLCRSIASSPKPRRSDRISS